MDYKCFGAERLPEVRAMYEESGWRAYLGDDGKLRRTLANSLYMLGAFEGETLVGFVRCVGDGEHIVYVQDLLVSEERRRKGIGRELMRRVFAEFTHVRMITLMTDAGDERANAFYRSMGMKPYENGGLAGYFHYR